MRNGPILFVLALAAGGCDSGMDEDAVPDGEASDDAELGIGDGDKADGVTLGYRAVMRLAHNAGLPCNSRAVVATAVARAESSFITNNHNYNGNGSYDYGLWQINTIHGYSRTYLYDPVHNAHAMAVVSNDGRNFKPWVAYNSGAYRKYLSSAWSAQAAYGCK
jgi:hypothetical protein